MRRKNNLKPFFTVLAAFYLALFFCACRDKSSDPKLDPLQEKAREHYLKGRRLFLTCDPNNYPLAIQEYQQALAYWDEYPEALAAFAETYSMWRGFYMTDDEFAEAYRSAQRALRLNPELAAGYRAIADLFRHKGESERALRQIENAINYEPDNAENYYVKGSTFLSQDTDKAIEALLYAAKMNPDLGKTYYNLGAAYISKGDYENAEKSMLRYVELVPYDPSGNISLGMIYRDLGRIDEAVSEFEKASAQPNITKPWEIQWLHMAYIHLGQIKFDNFNDYEAALEYFKKADEAIPNNLETQYFLGLACDKLGRDKEAADYYYKALEINKEFTPAQEALEALRKKSGKRGR